MKCKANKSQLNADYFRWLYTAITRTSKNLYLLDPPRIKLGAGLKIVGQSAVTSCDPTTLATSRSYDPLPPNHLVSDIGVSQEVGDEFDFDISPHAHFSLEILSRVKGLISASGISIKSVKQNKYQESYTFQREDDEVRIDIAYKASGKISQITSSLESELNTVLLRLLAPLKDTLIIPVTAVAEIEYDFGEDFLNEFHQRLASLAKEHDIIINNVEKMEWSQRYTFLRANESTIFDIYYNGKNQFKKCAPVGKARAVSSLIVDVEKMLTEGMSA